MSHTQCTSLTAEFGIVAKNLCGFELFLKTAMYGALNILESIAKWQPLGYLAPRFACVTPQSSTLFPDINPSILSLCEQKAQPALFLRGHNYIFICPGTCTWPERPCSINRHCRFDHEICLRNNMSCLTSCFNVYATRRINADTALCRVHARWAHPARP